MASQGLLHGAVRVMYTYAIYEKNIAKWIICSMIVLSEILIDMRIMFIHNGLAAKLSFRRIPLFRDEEQSFLDMDGPGFPTPARGIRNDKY